MQLCKITTQKGAKSFLFQKFVKRFMPMLLLRCSCFLYCRVILCNGSTSTLLRPLPHRLMVSICYASMQKYYSKKDIQGCSHFW